MRDIAGAEVRRDDVYFHVKEQVDNEASTPTAMVGVLGEFRRFAWYYARLLRPNDFEPNAAAKSRVARLHHLRSTTAYPFLMNVLEAVGDDRLTAGAYTATLDLIEAFLVRRLVCGIPSHALRKIFAGLCPIADDATDTPTFLAAVRDALSQGQRCPTDAAFRDALARRVMYGAATRDVTRYLSNRIERSFGHKEAADPEADDVQIEHVMPQTLTDAWWAELSPDDLAAADAVHAQWLHTLGNLTLTGYNPKLGNKSFAEKRAVFLDSHFGLNTYFTDVARWDAAAIQSRGERLAEKAVAIWPDVAADRKPGVRTKVKRAKPPVSLAVVIDGQRYPTASMVEATQQVFGSFRQRDPASFDKALVKAMPKKRRGPTSDGMRAPKQVGEGLWLDLHNSGKALRKRCERLVAAMKLPAETVVFETAPA